MKEAYSPIDLAEMGKVSSVDDQLCFARPFDISPDSTQVAFTWNATGNWELHVVPIAGGTPRRLTSGPGNKYYPRWSPDGKRIAYLRVRMGQRTSTLHSRCDMAPGACAVRVLSEETRSSWACTA
ncbi:MAG: hypothetical protein MUP64_03070 [Anaerolineae bacterium]|nr:hypothetical protein [Anaerolineae bacterium]